MFKPSVVFVFLASALFFAGCGDNPHKTVPVSGTVKKDGKGLPNAKVLFQPETKPGATASDSSVGTTDSSGNFILKTTSGKDGAVWGKHVVRITTGEAEPAQEGQPVKVIKPETVPAKYNVNSELKYEVPQEGTNAANFTVD
jgi:hypothetical protein